MKSAESMKSVLMIGEYGSLNGGEFSLIAAIPALKAAGFQLCAGVPGGSEFADALTVAGVDVCHLSFLDDDGERLSQGEIRNRIAELIDRLKPDLVHANSLSTSRLVGPVAKGCSVKSLGYIRDIIKISKKATSDVNQLDRIIAVSKATADFHIANGVEKEKLRVVYNGIDLRKFYPKRVVAEVADIQSAHLQESPDSSSGSSSDSFDQVCNMTEELGLPNSARLCLFVGQIGMRKGIELMLDAVEPIFERHADVHLLIVGERHSKKNEAIEYEQRLRKKSETRNLKDRVHWLGRRTDVAHLMRQSHLLIHPAKQEPLGRVLLESLASGLPIVTTRVGGSPEILEGFEQCLFPADQFAIESSALIERFLFDNRFHQETSIAFRRRAEKLFDSRDSGKHLLAQYVELLS